MKEKNESKSEKAKESREKKKQEQILRVVNVQNALEEKIKINAIIDSIGDGIIVQDTDFKIIYQNQIQNVLFGNRVGEYCYEAYEGRDTICEDCPVELTFRDGKTHRVERCMPGESGISYFELASSPLRDSTGRIIAGIKIIRDITNTRRAEEELKRSEDKYHTLFETMAQGVVYQDVEGKIISANPAAERILGLTFEQMQGRTSVDPRWKAVHDDGSDFPGEEHPSMTALRTGEEVRDEVMGVYNPEKERYGWININAIPQFRPGEDRPYQVYATFEDITELKRAEKLIRESEEKYRNLVELTTDIIYISDRHGNHVFMNDAGYRMLEAPQEEVLGKPWSNWIHPDDRDRSLKKFTEMVEKGIDVFSFENRYLSKSGKVINALHNVRIIRNEKGEIVGTQGFARDITRRTKAEEALKESEKKYRMLVNNIHDGVFIIQDAKMQFVNDALARMSGYTVEEIIGKNFHELVAPEDREMVADSIKEDKREKSFLRNTNSICCIRTGRPGYLSI
jgi:PAS domain S-box-containing protein